MTGEIADLIRDVFASVPRPHGPDLAPHACPECEDVRRLLEPHTFQDVPDDVLDHLGDSLVFLGPRGLHYYLPAYLLRTLRSPDWQWIENLVFHLSPSEEALRDRPAYWNERLAVFSSQQRGAIRSFVEWLRTTPVGEEYEEELSRAQGIWKDAA